MHDHSRAPLTTAAVPRIPWNDAEQLIRVGSARRVIFYGSRRRPNGTTARVFLERIVVADGRETHPGSCFYDRRNFRVRLHELAVIELGGPLPAAPKTLAELEAEESEIAPRAQE